jgi:diketogulonate reductase-like aldo/keto reductase
MPLLGFGTYQLTGKTAVEMVKAALHIGYRHIDTAQAYDNESEVGHAILEAGYPRGNIFITTKVWPDRFQPDQLANSVTESLRKLETEYVDLLLLHWPSDDVPMEETLEALMAVQQAGQARHIGVSNFTIDLMRQAVDICGQGTLVNNQIEYHPFLNQEKVIRQAKDLDMSITAYRPIAKGKVFDNDTLQDIATRHNKTAAQVTLRWIIQQGVAAIPRTSQTDHAEQNFDVFDFTLTEDEMAAISSLRGNERLVSPTGLAPDWDTPEPVATR